MTKVLFPAWNMDTINWARLQNTLRPIAQRNDLVVVYPDHLPEVKESWATFVRIPTYRNFKLIDMISLTEYVTKIIMKTGDFDLVYCFSSGPFFQLIAVLLAEMANKPCVMHINGHAALSRTFFMTPLRKMQEDAVDTLGLNSVDVIVPICSHLRDVIKARVINPDLVLEPVPFSVDLEAFQPGPMPSKLCVGYAGRISPEKGTEFLLKVMAETPEMRYRIAGPIEKMEGKFPDNCNYTGMFEHHEMPFFYALNSIMTLPSHGEGISALILEAYACGRGVIATPEAHPEELPIIGYEVPLELEPWKKAIQKLTMAKVAKKGIEARKWIEKEWPSWDDFGIRMSQIFKSVDSITQ